MFQTAHPFVFSAIKKVVYKFFLDFLSRRSDAPPLVGYVATPPDGRAQLLLYLQAQSATWRAGGSCKRKNLERGVFRNSRFSNPTLVFVVIIWLFAVDVSILLRQQQRKTRLRTSCSINNLRIQRPPKTACTVRRHVKRVLIHRESDLH